MYPVKNEKTGETRWFTDFNEAALYCYEVYEK